MKKLALLIVFFIPFNVFPQLANTTYLIPAIGISIPANNSSYKSSFNAGITFEFAMTRAAVFGFDLNFANLSSKKVLTIIPLSMDYSYIGAGNYSTMGFMAYAKLQDADAVKSAVQPFVKAGIGTSLIAQTDYSSVIQGIEYKYPVSTSTGILLDAGAGLNIMIHQKNKIVLEAQYRINKSDTNDVRMFLLNLGYAFRL